MLDILYLLSNKERYIKYIKNININILSNEDIKIIESLDTYYSKFPDKDIDWDSFSTWFLFVEHPTLKQDKVDIYRILFENIKKFTPSSSYDDIVAAIIKREHAAKIADKAMAVADGSDSDIDGIQEILDEYTTKYAAVSNLAAIEDMPTFQDLNATINSASLGLEWRLEALNKSLGPLRKGDFIIIGKRPETGGTTFACSEATFMAAQLDDSRPVLYIANEESELAIRNRLKQAAIGKDTPTIAHDTAKAESLYTAAVGSRRRIQLRHKPGVSINDINAWLEVYRPGLIVIDQLWKVRGFHGMQDVQRLTMLFAEARRWAQEYAPVIAIHQADGSAANEKYIPMEALYMSKTGVQGEADAIIMVGATDEVGYETTRFLNICKNKLLGGPNTDDALRHGKFEVKIKANIARFEDK